MTIRQICLEVEFLMVYHTVVKAKVRAAFAEISKGNWESMVDSLAPQFSYTFYGEHALSGERHTHAAMRLWWERIDRVMPGPRFEVQDIVVAGWPWNTTVATSVRVRTPLPDGSYYENVVNQFMKMRWARIYEVRTLEDTVVLQRALDVVAASGIEEAHAAPITDADAAGRTARA
ncbi:nuclear transport factor 2 family protein [Kitasatospora viridis]|uniref:Ketosteroid isomerase-like protein n=1 Tax=Kitasatospora viridis TaxID=281105 RepID=A0A561UD90_9ACTN|nr:nuclear transport factor 2 family protein [Kitasatospora viridis]TWF97305.1 ketosteroid isomerase-like protein [Kitasatospora viridis]